MSEVVQASAPELSPADSRKWIGRIVIAVVLGEATWGFLVSITNGVVVPAIAKVLGGDPQSSLYLGKGDFNLSALFTSVVELCLAGIAAILLYSSTQRATGPRPRPARLAPVVAPRSAPVAAPPANPPANPPADSAVQTKVSVTSKQPALPAPPSTPGKPPTPAKAKRPKRVYYNIVGERVEEEDE